MAPVTVSVDLDAFVAELGQAREEYAFPARLQERVEQFVDRTLTLLFPHFAAEVGGSSGDVAEELAALRTRLGEGLRLPGTYCSRPDEVVEQFFADLPELRAALLLDAQALYDGDPAARSTDEIILAYPGFLATAYYRIAHELQRAEVPLLPRMITEIAHRKTGIDIHPGAEIGPSLAIDHGTGIVIGETAELGSGVKLYQGVTLGALSVEKHMAAKKRHPTIGDGVVIYANATILGGDTIIGAGSRIGGNVWLTKSVPSGSVVTPTARVDRSRKRGHDELLDFNI